VIDGWKTVVKNNLPTCRRGDTILEPVGPPNKIAEACPTVMVARKNSHTPVYSVN